MSFLLKATPPIPPLYTPAGLSSNYGCGLLILKRIRVFETSVLNFVRKWSERQPNQSWLSHRGEGYANPPGVGAGHRALRITFSK